jgi:hypothetical protein
MFVYSFKDSAVSITDPDAGPFSFSGEQGVGQFVVSMATERTVLATASDGAIMGSAIAGDSGHISIECQQTSDIHAYLLGWLNAKIARQNNGDVTTWFGMKISVRNVTTNTAHTLTGVGPSKMPDYPYSAQGQNITWMLPAANVVNS